MAAVLFFFCSELQCVWDVTGYVAKCVYMLEIRRKTRVHGSVRAEYEIIVIYCTVKTVKAVGAREK